MRRPDAAFVPGELGHLVVGNTGRLLDSRRTPVEIIGLDTSRGYFEVEIQAFEDAGAHWLVPLEDVGRYQFALGSRTASGTMVAEFRGLAARLDRPLRIEVEPGIRERTLDRLQRERADADRFLTERGEGEFDPLSFIEQRLGEPRLFELTRAYLERRGLERIDSELAETFVSNPHSGEQVKGHAIILAELGLCRFQGKAIRDPRLFSGAWSRVRRGEHILTRLALTQSLWSRAGRRPPLYRGFSTVESPDPRPDSFVSATFSRPVAEAHDPASVREQELPLERLLMTFLETEAMNRRFREAEAILIGSEPPALF